jgi:predicted ATP-grasp superfamily ATP-dependent carboligase
LVQDDLDAFLEATEMAVTEGRYEAVLCSEDAQVFGLSLGRDRISAEIPYPPHDVVARAFDKLELCRAAQLVGMATPETVPANDHSIANAELPVIVKSRLHWTPGAQRRPARLEAAICRDRREVRRRVTDIQECGGDAVLQEVVRGRQVHCMVIVDEDGGFVAGVQTLAEPLYYPGPDVGQRVRSVTVRADEGLREKTMELMSNLRWVGMTSLMFLRPDGGEPALVDFNSRIVASSDQYIAAGVNFPAIWACMVTGRPLPAPGPVKVGVRFQWLEGDLRRALTQRRGGLLHDVVDCLSYAPGAVHTLWRTDDPIPAARLGVQVAHQAIAKAGAKLGSGTRR